MVVVFAQAHRGKTIGEQTGGSTGQPLMFKLPGGGLCCINLFGLSLAGCSFIRRREGRC